MAAGGRTPARAGGRGTVVPFLRPPRAVIAYLRDPRERFWGVLRALDATGLVLQGVDLDSFDHWVREAAAGGDAPASTVYFPLLRLEKLLVDSGGPGAPSLADQFARRVGRPLHVFLGIDPRDLPAAG